MIRTDDISLFPSNNAVGTVVHEVRHAPGDMTAPNADTLYCRLY
jgi:hypothetical protein